LEQFERDNGMGPLNLLQPKYRYSRLGHENPESDGRLPNRELLFKDITCGDKMLKRF
jgi:hypothetical protein